MDYFIGKCKQKYEEENEEEFMMKDKLLVKFRQAATDIKEMLSSETEATYAIDSLDFTVEDFTRAQLEEICAPIF